MTDLFAGLAALTGADPDQILAGPLGAAIRSHGVGESPDLDRVLALPSLPSDLPDLSPAFRKNPNVSLFPDQNAALCTFARLGGLLGDMPVGSGKTLVTMLLPVLADARRPVLLIPAALRTKTRREYAIYFRDWNVRLPTIRSYQELGAPKKATELIDLRPDLLILDEAHFARNLDAAVTRRIKRAITEINPRVACLSGTLITAALMDYWHHLCWALRERAPVPLIRAEAERWARAVDREAGPLKRLGLGALETIPGGYHQHMRTRAGVVSTTGTQCGASIEFSTWTPTLPESLKNLIRYVETTSLRPDGEPLDDWDLPACLCQLALGFFYVWDPLPPDWWLRPRRGWLAYARAVLDEHIDAFDSIGQIAQALDRRTAPQPPAPDEGRELLALWRSVKTKFTPNPVPVWVDDAPLRQARDEAEPGTILWVRFRAAGNRLDQLGVPYYGANTNPETANGQTIAASIDAHGTGKNLQAWAKARILTPMANADAYEQLIGRLHRPGQTQDLVSIQIIDVIEYHQRVLERVRSEARAQAKATGRSPKLLIGDWTT